MSTDAYPVPDGESDDDPDALRDRVAALEETVAAQREVIEDLREELSTVKTIATTADGKANRADRAVFGKAVMNDEKEAVIEQHPPLADVVHGDDFGGVAQVREDLEAERAYRDRSLATLRAKLDEVAEIVGVDLDAPDDGDAISRLLARGPSAVTDRPGKVHERARAILRNPQWGDHGGSGRVTFRANQVRLALSAMESEQSGLDPKAVHRAFDKLEALAEGSARTVRTDTERDGQTRHRRLLVAYTSSEYEEVADA